MHYVDRQKEIIKQSLSNIFKRINRHNYTGIIILRFAMQRFSKARGSEAAASTAFFTIFSLFPLLLVLVALGGYFLESQQIQDQILRLVRVIIPVSTELVINNLQQVLKNRSSIGAVGLVGLIWSGSGALSTLTRNITRAWPSARRRNFLENRMLALLIVATLFGLLMISTITSTVLSLLSIFSLDSFGEGVLFSLLTKLIPFIVGVLIFTVMYRWIPNIRVNWRSAIWAALFASSAWQVASSIFSWYLSSGLAQYKLVYGSLGTIVALMFWVYLDFLIILFGAHLCAAVDQYYGLGSVQR